MCVEGNSISYIDILLMVRKLMVNLGSLLANKLAEILIQAVSEHHPMLLMDKMSQFDHH
jgi:hypothetical protein